MGDRGKEVDEGDNEGTKDERNQEREGEKERGGGGGREGEREKVCVCVCVCVYTYVYVYIILYFTNRVSSVKQAGENHPMKSTAQTTTIRVMTRPQTRDKKTNL